MSIILNGTTGITTPDSLNVVANTSSDAVLITQTGTGNAFVVEDSTSPDATPFVIDARGRVINGHTASLSVGVGGNLGTQLTGSAGASGQTMARFDNSGTGARFQFLKSRNATPGSSTTVQNGDSLGSIAWYGDDGAADYADNGGVLAAFIQAYVDGTPGTNDMPGRLVFSTTADGASSPTERARIDSSGNVGVGVVPSASWGAYKVIQLGEQGVLSGYATGAGVLNIGANFYWNGSGYKYLTTNPATLYQQNAGAHNWRVAASGTADAAISFNPAMTLESNGNLLLGSTTGGNDERLWVQTTNDDWCIQTSNTGSGTFYHIGFRANSTQVGRITSTSTTTSYITSSDYRLKNSIAPMTGALAKVALLKPVTYKWNADDSDGEGFIAHELAEVCPNAVSGEKDAVNEDGSIKPQGIDTSFLVATLTAAIQEQQAIIESLTARVSALEASNV